MSILNDENLPISIDSQKLINDVTEDIMIFGKDFKVYAIYSYNDTYKVEYISDYVDADAPEYDPSFMTKSEYEKVRKDYLDNIESLKYTKHKLMTLDDLIVLLKHQNEI